MRPRIFSLLTVVLVFSLSAQEPRGVAKRDFGERPGPGLRFQEFCDAALPSVEAALYEALAPLSIQEQRKILRNATTDVKSRLWVHNQCVFLQNHPTLTMAQRLAIHDYLEYVAQPYVFEVEPELLKRQVKQLTLDTLHRVIDAAQFSPEELVTAFYHLGPSAPPRAQQIEGTGAGGDVSGDSGMPPCICSSNVDCWSYYALFCRHDPGGLCMPVMMCGYGGTEACDGIC